MFVLIAIAAIWIAYFVKSQQMWDTTRQQNAWSGYWTMRTNLESSRKSIAPADYERLKQNIDRDWKRLYPDLPIPNEQPADK